jgi:hypothetical protein
MQIKSLKQMENIVENNKFLSWDGWTVISMEKTEKARTSAQGAYVNGSWYIKKRFEPVRNGWEIPNKFVV